MAIWILAKERVLVPDLYNLSQAAAESAITSAGLVVGSVASDYDETIAAGNVYSQSPAAGTRVFLGTSVNIDVSLGSPQVSTYFSVAADADDGYQRKTELATSWMNIGYNAGDPFNCWSRFTNVTIPQGATIDSADCRLQIYALGTNSPVICTIYAHDTDSGVNPSTNTNLLNSSQSSPSGDGWLLTSASTSWNPVPTGAQWSIITSPSLTTVIQEIVNRPGWSSGNALTLVFKGASGTYRQFSRPQDGQAGRLYVTYTP